MRIVEKVVPNHPKIYRLVVVEVDGRERPTNRYRVRRRVKAGDRWTTRTQTFDSFDDAKFFARMNHEDLVPILVQSHRFAEVFGRFLIHKERKEGVAESSLDGYRVRAKHFRFFEELSLNEITPRAVDAWLDLLYTPEYLATQQKSRINYEHEYFLLSGVFRYYRNYESEDFKIPLLERHREIACKRSRTDDETEIRYLNTSEERAFLDALSKTATFHDVALFQLHTGARVGEVAALELNNIDWTTNEVRLGQHLHWERKKDAKIKLVQGTKGGPSRRVPLTRECRDMLIRRRRAATSSIVFESRRGGWLTYRSIQATYDRVFKKMELPHRGTHTLRHSFAVRFLDQTKDVHALQKLLGHADLKDTLRYAKYTNESVRRSFQLFRGGLAEKSEGFVPQLVPQQQLDN